jgi:hypothetical protein
MGVRLVNSAISVVALEQSVFTIKQIIFALRNFGLPTKMWVFVIIKNCRICDFTQCHTDFWRIYDWGLDVVKVNKVLYEQSILMISHKILMYKTLDYWKQKRCKSNENRKIRGLTRAPPNLSNTSPWKTNLGSTCVPPAGCCLTRWGKQSKEPNRWVLKGAQEPHRRRGETDREAVHWDSGGAEGAWYQIVYIYIYTHGSAKLHPGPSSNYWPNCVRITEPNREITEPVSMVQ